MFVHLNNHSDYSLQRSISPIYAIVDRAKELEQHAIAITDYGNLFGAVEFAKISRAAGIKAIYGCEFSVVPDKAAKTNIEKGSLVLLAMSDTGFYNLRLLSSLGYLEGFYYYPRIDFELLVKYQKDIICIIPQNSSKVTQFLEMGKLQEANAEVQKLKEMFGDRLYIEIQNHGMTLEYRLNQQLHELSVQTQVPLVAGNDCHYISQKDSPVHELFISAERQRSYIKEEVFSNDQYYIKSYDEMEMYLYDYKFSLQTTVEVADRCTFAFNFTKPVLPSFPLPAQFSNEDEYLIHLTMEGIKTRYGTVTTEIEERVKFELDVITSMQYSGYFLVVWDIISFARTSQIPVGPGRGSVTGSIVAYALRITNIDPIANKLLFERFLNPERISMPDIDTDFCFDRRQEVIEYIRNRYGSSHVGQIITFSQLKPRGAIRDVARVMNIDIATSDTIAKLVPSNCSTLEEAERAEPKLAALHRGEYTQLLDTATKLIGLHRHASLHAAGIVIGTQDLTEYVPLYKDPTSQAISTQYTMNHLEDCGLVKMDILGLRTLTIIDKAQRLIRKDVEDFSIENIQDRDAKTFEMLMQGNSDAVFQFESDGMKRMLTKIRPSCIDDLTALNALYRPGPMDYLDIFADAKNGVKKVTYLHDSLKPILEETYGVIVYQEQVMQIVRVVAGYTIAGADLFRRAMGKKDKKEMDRQRPLFVKGAVQNGYDEDVADAIFEMITPFAQYGFNKSHSAAYARLAYQTAYLKCHYSIHYIIACINASCSRQDDLVKHLKACKLLNIDIIPPDINFSDYEFSIEDGRIRYGLNAIKDISEGLKRHIPKERSEGGNYKSVFDFLIRLPNKRNLRKLLLIAVPIGLFDSVDTNREELFNNIDTIYTEAEDRLMAKKRKQHLLFSTEQDIEPRMVPATTTPTSFSEIHEILIKEERKYLGINIHYHPLSMFESIWKEVATITIKDLEKKMSTSEGDTTSPYYIIGYAHSVRDFVKVKRYKNSQKEVRRQIYVGEIEDFTGTTTFIYTSTPKKDNVPIEDCHVYGFIGSILSANHNYPATFLVRQVMSPEALKQYKMEHHPSLPTIAILTTPPYTDAHITISQSARKEDIQHLRELLLVYYGETRIFLHVRVSEEKEECLAVPDGLTVDMRNAQLLTQLEKLSFIEHIRLV